MSGPPSSRSRSLLRLGLLAPGVLFRFFWDFDHLFYRHRLAVEIGLNTEFVMMFLDLLADGFQMFLDRFLTSTDEGLDREGGNVPLLEGLLVVCLVPLHDCVDPTPDALL